jgi:hypothetical protein
MHETAIHLCTDVVQITNVGRLLGDLLITDQRLIFVLNNTHSRNSSEVLENSWALGLLGFFVESISREIRDSGEFGAAKRRARAMRSLRYGQSIDSLAAGSRFSTSKGLPVSIRADDSDGVLIVSDGRGMEGRFAPYGSERQVSEIARSLSSTVPTYDSVADSEGFYLTIPSPKSVITKAMAGKLTVSESEGSAMAENRRYIETLSSYIADFEPAVRIPLGRALTNCPGCLRTALKGAIKDPVWGFRRAVTGMPWPVGAVSLTAAVAVLIWTAAKVIANYSDGIRDFSDVLIFGLVLLGMCLFIPMIQGFRVLHNRNKFNKELESNRLIRSALGEE